jgi:hypothetical protein
MRDYLVFTHINLLTPNFLCYKTKSVYTAKYYRLSVTCNRSLVFSGYSGFLHGLNISQPKPPQAEPVVVSKPPPSKPVKQTDLKTAVSRLYILVDIRLQSFDNSLVSLFYGV